MSKAFILHRFAYQDADYIVKAYTQEMGLVSFVAKGARRNKKGTAGLLQPFLKVELDIYGKSDIKKLRSVELSESLGSLDGKLLYSGFYLNELMTYLCPQMLSSDEIFDLYESTVSSLSKLDETQVQELAILLRSFEFLFLRHLGIGPNLSHDSEEHLIEPEANYLIQVEHLPQKSVSAAPASFKGATLLAIESCDFNDKFVLKEAKRLLKYWIAHYCNGKVFKSREMFLGASVN